MAIRITLVLAVFCFNLNLLNCNYQFRDELASNPDLYPYHENHESQQNNDKDIIKVENLLQSHHWDTWNPKVESIEKYLEKELKELPMNAEIIENRSKKNKNYDSNSEAKPLKDHRRKGGDEFHDQANNESPAPNKLTCSSKFDTQKNMMIDSKASVKNGASLISVEKIPPKEDLKLTELEKSCMKLCCETDECDSSILSLKLGDEGYRCYLFKCNGNCFYIKHDDYIVSRMKSQEEIEGNKVKGDDSDLVITTGHRPENDHSNENSQNFIKVENYAPEDKPYFYDKSKATTSSANVTMAILVLILGISLILSFFAYLFASTKYFRRRIKWLNFNNKESKNLDVDGDYLINGMYL